MQAGGDTSGETHRCVVDGACVMLQDARLTSSVRQDWFEPQWWQARDARLSVARGRGNTWFVRGDHAATPPAGSESPAWVLRHYRRGGAVARLLGDRYLYLGVARSRPWREFHLLQSLEGMALPVPRVLAARVARIGAWYTGDLLTEAIADSQTLAALMITGSVSEELWSAVGQLVARFHAAGVFHADLNAHNVLVTPRQLWLIDFDRGRLRPRGAWCDAVLARLHRSLLKVAASASAPCFSAQEWRAVLQGYAATPVVAGQS